MSKINHHSLKYKQQAKPNKKYKELTQNQKKLISDLMFRFVYEFYSGNGAFPAEDDYADLAHKVYSRLEARAIWVPYDEYYNKGFLKKMDRIKERISNGEIYEKPEKKEKPDKKLKQRKPRKKCPYCGRKMKGGNGMKHCRCGVSFSKGTGYFERTPDMVFCLKRVRKGKKVKQVPWIRFEEDENGI